MCVSLQRLAPNTCTWDFPDVIKFRVAAHTISEKAIRFRHPDYMYNPDRAQKLFSLSMSRHLSTRNISSKSMHAFLSNLSNRQTDKRTRANAFTTSFVEGNNGPLLIGMLAVDGWAVTFVQRGGTWAGCGPAHTLFAVPNVTAHPSTASVPTFHIIRYGTLKVGSLA